MTSMSYTMLIIIEIISAGLGIIFYIVLSTRVHIIWTSFLILPVITATFLLFIGIWISNDYFIYENTWKV